MKVLFCFKDIELGELSLLNNTPVYNSFPEGEARFKDETFSFPFYDLFDSNNKELTPLPRLLSDFVDMTKLPFYSELIGVKEDDSDFVRLYKLSMINLENFGFYIKAKS